jgi:hypothetical protein
VTVIPFAPNSNNAPPFTALVTLDGTAYSLTAMWNLYRGGWYINLVDQSGNLILNQPLIASPDTYDIPLAPGTFTASTIVYRDSSRQFEIVP